MFNRITASLVAALALTACGTPDEIDNRHTHAVGHDQPLTVTHGGFTIDSHLLEAQTPSGKLPVEPLSADAFEIEHLSSRLGDFSTPMKDHGSFGTRISLGSPAWRLEVDQTRGLATIHAQTPKQGFADLPPEHYRQQSLARLQAWGIQPDSVARVLQRQLMKQERTIDGDVKQPLVHRHKTYVYRGVDGIQVEGHRAVITHHTDGSFHRASLAWPPLAQSGHRLTTKLQPEAIVQRAVKRLEREGEAAGEVTLRWGYVPTVHDNGETTLELKAIVRLVGVPHDDHGTEDRVFELSVDAR